MKNKTLFMTEVAIFASLALLLDMVSGFIFSRIWPQGGSISIAMVPIFSDGISLGHKRWDVSRIVTWTIADCKWYSMDRNTDSRLH